MKFIALSELPLIAGDGPCIKQNLLTKPILVMSLTTAFLLSVCLVAAAAGHGQNRAPRPVQGITLSLKHAPIMKVFSEIKRQTGYSFIYSDNDIAGKTKPIDLDVQNADIREVLDLCFKDSPLTYSIDGKYVIIKLRVELPKKDIPPGGGIGITGKVVDENGQGLAGSTIKITSTKFTIITGSNGAFSVQLPDSSAVLVVSYIGYKTKEVFVSGADVDLVIRLEQSPVEMKGVEVVSTGYESLPKERATGSFEQVNNELFNRSTGPTVIARLEGIVPALLFDKRHLPGDVASGLAQMTIRGLSTLTSNTEPLIVLDNIPYEGDVSNINPNDVESITVLKDAAAASIWGVRAGNGVIVITTKKGTYDRPLQISFNTNLIVQKKPDLFYLPQMNTNDFIGVEKFLFTQGNYDYLINDSFTHPFITPVIDLLAKERAGSITAGSADAQIASLSQYDARNDYLKYVYRNSVNQQYALNINGGAKNINYIISIGYDKGLADMVRVGNDRITLRSNLSLKPIQNLEIQVGSLFTQNKTQTPGGDLSSFLTYTPGILPYTRLVDGQGSPLVVGRDYNAGFAANPGDSRLLNWQFRPLGELDASTNTTHNYDALFNLGAKYQFSKVLNAEVKYQYERALSEQKDWEGPNAYYTRNLINLYTQPVGSAVEKPIPYGSILNESDGNAYSYTLRGQLNLNKEWNTRHRITAIAGAEVRENHSESHHFATYGYNDQDLTYQPVDFTTYYSWYIPSQMGSGGTIPNGLNFSNQTYRFTSLYGNAAYTYDNRYTLSASVRKDASNLFGVNSNQRGVPLWSAGLGWNISRESFYECSRIPLLRFRATYGYNGNTNNAISAFSIISYGRGPSPYTGLPDANISDPANPNLRWEKVGIANFGLDFGLKGNRLSGSLEYFTKNSKDLVYAVPIGLTTGFSSALENAVAMMGKGVDISLHSSNLSSGAFKWMTDLTFSYNTNKVTRYTPLSAPAAAYYLSTDGGIAPITGKTLYAVYSYKWAGLDPQTGDPQGYVNKQVSKDYITMDYDSVQNLQYHGSAIPIIFGSFRNTFSWKKISLSVNILYKLNYYFRRASINYAQLFNPYTPSGHADFSKRWQKPGDERITNVPSMVYPDDSYRDLFYQNSAALISRADHIRLQDITASYTLDKPNRAFKSLRLYGNISNLGIIWRANKQGIDPDYGGNYPAPKAFTIGLSGNF